MATTRLRFSVLIPARRDSTRLPGKALADIGGKAMVVRVCEAAAASSAQRVAVATDDDAIAQAVHAAGFEAVMTRADHGSGTDRVAEAAVLLGLPSDELVVNVQGDEPLMPPALIDRVAAELSIRDGCAIATAAHPIAETAEWFDPNAVKVVRDGTGLALYFSRAPIPFARDALAGFPDAARPATLPGAAAGLVLRHVGIYAYRAAFLAEYPELAPAPLERLESLEQLRALWHGYAIAVAVVDDAPPAGVDTPADLARVRAFVASSGN